MQALVNEIRQLRLAVERSMLTVPRIQVALQRIQMQQQRVDQLSQRLQESKTKVSAAAEEKSHLQMDLQQIETRLPQEQDAAARKQQAVRQLLQNTSARDGERRAQEIEIAGQFQVEQAKLEELGRELTTLQGSLGEQGADAKAPQR